MVARIALWESDNRGEIDTKASIVRIARGIVENQKL